MDTMNFAQGSIFDLFGVPATPAVENKTTAPAGGASKTASGASAASTKSDAKKPAVKKKGGRKLSAPVTVYGTGYKFVYGEEGKSYTPEEVLKAMYDAGYRSIACCTSAMRYKKEEEQNNALFLKDMIAGAGNGDWNVPSVEVRLGMRAAEISAARFEGKEPEEVTLDDMAEAWAELNPDFQGCQLAYNAAAAVAMPVFGKPVGLAEEKSDTIKVWSDSKVIEFSKAEALELYKEYDAYKSGNGTYFMFLKPDMKKMETVLVSDGIFGLETKTAEKAKEFFRLPATIWVEQYGAKIEASPDYFGGKEKITQEDVINFLKPNYKAFQSKSREFECFYDDGQKVISIFMKSGKKGAASAVVPFFEHQKVQELSIGRFTTLVLKGGYKAVFYERAIPRIPGKLLDNIIRYFKRDTRVEAVVCVYYNLKNGTFFLKKPFQVVDKVSAEYKFEHMGMDNVLVLTAHSHNTMAAQFSGTDDRDEDFTGLFMVVGRLQMPSPEVTLRVGMEGDFGPLSVNDIFDVEGGGLYA